MLLSKLFDMIDNYTDRYDKYKSLAFSPAKTLQTSLDGYKEGKKDKNINQDIENLYGSIGSGLSTKDRDNLRLSRDAKRDVIAKRRAAREEEARA